MSALRNAGVGGGSTSANNLGGAGGDQAFVDCIMLYSKNLEADAISTELQVFTFMHI